MSEATARIYRCGFCPKAHYSTPEPVQKVDSRFCSYVCKARHEGLHSSDAVVRQEALILGDYGNIAEWGAKLSAHEGSEAERLRIRLMLAQFHINLSAHLQTLEALLKERDSSTK